MWFCFEFIKGEQIQRINFNLLNYLVTNAHNFSNNFFLSSLKKFISSTSYYKTRISVNLGIKKMRESITIFDIENDEIFFHTRIHFTNIRKSNKYIIEFMTFKSKTEV